MAAASQQDLSRLEQFLLMRLSEVQADVALIAEKNREALGELGAYVALLNQQLADAILNAADPVITNEAFLADLASMKDTAEKLAAIVPPPDPV
jgi:hypothetical protein